MTNKVIQSSFYRQLAIACDLSPEKPLAEVWNDCRKELLFNGLSKEIIDEFEYDKYIKNSFLHQFLPNPDYWRKKLGQNFSFFLVDANSKDYLRLIKVLNEFIPDITYFVCYGEKDVIIRFLGDDNSVKKLETILENEGFHSAIVHSSETTLFYDKEVPNKDKYEKLDLSVEKINEVLNTNPEDTDPTLILKLEKAGLILNSVFFEDTHLTGRIRAFIRIMMNRILNSSQMHRIENKINNINNKEFTRTHSRPISSIYQCDSPFVAFFVEGIFDNQEQLDVITDAIQEIEYIGDTETMIVAKAIIKQIPFSRNIINIQDEAAIVQMMLQGSTLQLLRDFNAKFPKLSNIFSENVSEKQFLVLSIFNEICGESIKIDINNYPLVNDYIEQFFNGILSDNLAIVQNSGSGYIRDVVEKEHLDFVQTIITNIFNNDLSLMQMELRAPNSNWRKWGLFQWGRVAYPIWNKNQIYHAILDIPIVLLNDLEYLGISRNSFAHKSDINDINQLVYTIRDVFLRSYNLLKWIEDVRLDIENPMISIGEFRKIITNTNHEKLNALSKIDFNENEIIKTINIYKKLEDTDINKAILLLDEVLREEKQVDLSLITSIKEIVFPIIRENERSIMDKLLKLLKEKSLGLPDKKSREIIVYGLLSCIDTR